MKSKLVPFLATSALVFPAHAADISSVSNGAWDAAATWSDNLAPATGNNYIIDGEFVNTPNLGANGTRTFTGDSLTVASGRLDLKVEHNGNVSGANFVIPNFSLTGGTLRSDASNGNSTLILQSPLTVSGTNAIEVRDGSYTNSLNLSQGLTGSGLIQFSTDRSGNAGTGERAHLRVNGAGNTYSGDWTVRGFDTTGEHANLWADAAGSLGTGSVELLQNGRLINQAAGGVDTLSGVTLSGTGALLSLVQPWNQAAASLTVNAGRVDLPDSLSEIGTLSGTGGAIQGIGAASALKVNQTVNGSYAGSLGFTAGNSLAFTKAGAADLMLAGPLDPAIPVTLEAGGLGLGSSQIASLTQSGGNLLLELGTSSNDQPVITGDYTSTGGGIGVSVTSPPLLDTPYTLVSYQGTLTGSPAVSFEGLTGSRVTPAVEYGTGSNSTISVSFSGESAALVWTGTPSGTWDITTSQAWSNGGSTDTFFQFDGVTFDDTATGTTSVLLDETVSPGSVVFNNSSLDYTLSGSGGITGVTGIVKDGSGTATIATNNTNTGTTQILAGTLRLGSGGSTGSLGAGDVLNEGVLEFNRSDDFTFANLITGNGSVSQAGSGTTILTGENSYLGTTTVSAGTLQVGDGGETGSLGFTSGVVNDGILAFNRGGTLLVSGPVSGSGSLVQNGPGMTVLETDATYTGGTTINGGSLKLGNGDLFGSVAGAVVNNGDLSVDRVDDIDFANTVTGTGTFTHAGLGTLRLTGDQSYTGETRVIRGILQIDSGSALPDGGSFAFTGGSGLLKIEDGALTTLPGFRSVGGGGGANVVESATPLTVTGGDLAVGPDEDATHFLDLSFIPSFTYEAPGNVVSIGSQSDGATSRSATLILPASASFTASAFNIQSAKGPLGFNNTDLATGTLQLGQSTTIHADTINMGFNRDHGSILLTPGVFEPELTLRATDGSGRVNINMGNRGTAYGTTQNVTIDLLSGADGISTLDALVGTLKIGDYARGLNQTQNASFLMGEGTLDATEIILGSIYNNNGNNGVLNSTLSVQGGSVIAPTVNFGSKTNGTLNSRVELFEGGSLSATTVLAGPGAANRVLDLSAGTLSNIAGQDLSVEGIKILVGPTASASLNVAAGDLAYFGTGTTFEFRYDSSLPGAGTLTVTGDAEIDSATTVLALADDNFLPEPLAAGEKLVLIQYAAGSFTGTFVDGSGNPLADGATILAGSQLFAIDYDDPAHGGKAVTLTAQEGGTYSAWAAVNAGGGSGEEDFDGDGVPNAVEYFMGETGSSFTPTPGLVADKVTWPKDPAALATYEVQTSTTLAPEGQPGGWTTVTEGVSDTGSLVEYTLPAGAPKNFVRLKVTLP